MRDALLEHQERGEMLSLVAIVVVSLVTLVYVFLTGDAGARATWEQPSS